MKKANGLTKRVVAILLSSMLTVGTFPGNAIASEVQENTVQEEEAITTYAVTLDANGGYFENEWDDVLGEYIESTEILNKRIPVGGTVSTFPVKEQENVIVTFKGWSIERDGEIVSQGNEEYAPIENCVLYAVWNVGEHSDTSTEDEVWEDTNNQDEESFGASANQNEASKIGTTQGSEDTSSEDGNAEEDLSVGDYNVLELEEDEKETLGQQDDTPYQETINAAKNEQEESVREDASMGVVKSGTCGTNLTWTLDGNGILTISSSENVIDSMEIPNNVFKGFESIHKVIILEGVEVIGISAFEQCINLKEVHLPSSLIKIGRSAFANCCSLSSIDFPDGLKTIEDDAFYSCIALKKIVFPNTLEDAVSAFDGSGVETVEFKEGTKTIAPGVMQGADELKKIVFPNGVTKIGMEAFSGCISLTEIIIPSGVKEIEERAFECCEKLTSVSIPDGITCISYGLFSNCVNLTTVNIPDSVVEIKGFSFGNCSNLLDVHLSNNLRKMGMEVFTDCNALKRIVIPKTLEDAGLAFNGSGIETVEFKEGTKTIAPGVMQGAEELNSIVFPNGVTKIGQQAFEGCNGLTDIVIPSGLIEIGDLAFDNCKNLKTVSIPSSVTTIGGGSFGACDILKIIYFLGHAPEIESDAFYDDIATAYYPADDLTWTDAKKIGYGGKITWKVAMATIDNYFVIGRDSNRFSHSNIGSAVYESGRIGEAYPTSLYYYGKLLDGLSFTEELALLDYMYKESGWGGSCEGLAISMGMAYLKKIDISKLDGLESSPPRYYNELKYPSDNPNLRDLINYYQLLQMAKKNNKPRNKLVNLGYGIIFLDGELVNTLKQDFWQGFVNDVIAAKSQKIPLLFCMGYSKGGGHALLTCGYKKDNKYDIIQFYDSNRLDSYLYLFIDRSNYKFWFSTSGDSIEECNYYANNDNWNYFEYFGADNWDSIDGDIEPSKESYYSSINLSASKSDNPYMFFTAPAGEPFIIENNSGEYLEYSNNELRGTLDVYDLEIVGDSSLYRFKIAYDEHYYVTNFNDSVKFCFRTDNDYLSALVKGVDRISVENGNTLGIDGSAVSYNVRMSTNPDKGLIELIGTASDNVIIEQDEGNILIKSDDLSDVEVNEYKREGGISSRIFKRDNSDENIIRVVLGKTSLTEAVVTGLSSKIYTGKALTQTPTVKIGSTTLRLNIDYTVSFSNNTNPGTASVTISGKGNYNGTKTATFTINKANQNITVKTTASSIGVGKTATVSTTGDKGKVTYKSSNTTIATVNATSGVVTGKKAGTVTITATSAATSNYNAASKTVKITVTANKSLKKPGNCHFAKWNNAKYTSCQIAWNKVAGADGYQTLLSWTNGTHASATIVNSNVLYRNCTVHPQHVSQMKVRAFYTEGGKRVFGPWSNIEYITPSPAKLTAKNAGSGSNVKMNISWNIIYGCNGYNVFITTNPNGTWYWNQSTSTNATATSAVITKYRGSGLKKNTRYYVRIVTRRKRNGVFCTVPMPAKNTYVGSFIIK